MRVWRWVLGVYAIAAVIGFGWVFNLPDKEQCAARGDVVDPTERHCGAAADTSNWVQLEEHALFHSRDIALGILLSWSVIGATSGIGRRGRELVLSGGRRLGFVVALLVVQAASLLRSAAQVTSIAMVGHGGSRAGWVAGADWDPGSYRANLRAAELLAGARRCRDARPYARRAVSLFPDAPVAKRVARACGA